MLCQVDREGEDGKVNSASDLERCNKNEQKLELTEF